jgi:hypothetical protein
VCALEDGGVEVRVGDGLFHQDQLAQPAQMIKWRRFGRVRRGRRAWKRGENAVRAGK